MKRIYTILTILAALWIFVSCSLADDEDTNSCEKTAIVDNDLFNNGPDDLVHIDNVEIIGNCLHLTYGSSGCDGSTWEINLYDSGDIMESNPPQRTIRLSLKNEELCDAAFSKETSFELRDLQVEGNSVYLNLEGWEGELLYSY